MYYSAQVSHVWMSSSGKPPCWWHLVQALKIKKTTHKTLAEKFEAENSKLVPLSINFIGMRSAYYVICP